MTESLLMDELRKMARRSLELFEQLIVEARSVLAAEKLSAAKAMEKIKESQGSLLQETEELMNNFRLRVIEKERELQVVLLPSREKLADQALQATRQFPQIIERFTLNENLTRSWDDKHAVALLGAYQEALAENDISKIDMFEAESERFLAWKGDAEALAKFIALRAQFRETRLTPAQQKAKAALEELRRIKEEATIGLAFLASASEGFDRLIPLTALWRKEVRADLDQVIHWLISLSINREGDLPVPVTLIDISKSGLGVRASERFSKGTILDLWLKCFGMTERAISFKGVVRWCREEPSEPGRYALGLRIVEGTEGAWVDLILKLLDQLNQFKALFSSSAAKAVLQQTSSEKSKSSSRGGSTTANSGAPKR